MISCRGWPKKLNLWVGLGMFFATLTSSAGSLTVRDIQAKGNQIEIQLDGLLPRNSIEVDYVRDIVQFSVQNATIYPAKIIHAESQSFSKVFAYQYSPNLVRIRLSVEGAADRFHGKVKWTQKGKSVVIDFPENAPKSAEIQEKSLLAKVMSAARKSTESNDVKVEKIANEGARDESSKAEKLKAERSAKEEKAREDKLKAEEAKEVKEESVSKDESKDRHLTGKGSEKGTALSGMKSNGPSVFRSFLAMFLVVGGLGLVLVYVKKKKGAVQAKKVGDSWLSGLLPASMRKQKSFIEVLAQHPLGPKQSLVVVKIRGQQFVLGVTQDNVQLISQLDADEAELDLLDDPAVAASIGKMFGGKPTVTASFNSMIRKSDGAGAIIARRAYESSTEEPVTSMAALRSAPTVLTQVPEIKAQQNGIRDQIRRRLEGMKSV